MNSKQRTIWLTGGSSGIGATLCKRLLEQGAQVVNFSRRASPVESDRLINVPLDLMDAEATRVKVQEIAVRFPATEIIHNAGITFEKNIADVSTEDLEKASQLHLGAAIILLQAALPTMRARRFGRVVLLSTRAVVGLEKRTVYSATKAGMIGMARTWALELAGDGITVNVVAPGPIEDTEMFHEVVPKDSALIRSVTNRIPVGRLGTPDDVSRSVEFFLDENAGFITGQTLFVCGGTSVGNMSFT